MLESEQDKIKYNKITELKSILKEIETVFRHNKYANRKNESISFKLRVECLKESGFDKDPFSITRQSIYRHLFSEKEKTLNKIEFKPSSHLFPWITKSFFWSTLCVDKAGNSIKIDTKENRDVYGVNITLYHILYNKLKNKKRCHTNDDKKWIEENNDHWKLMLERMDINFEEKSNVDIS